MTSPRLPSHLVVKPVHGLLAIAVALLALPAFALDDADSKLEFTLGATRSLSDPFDGVVIRSRTTAVIGVNYERGNWFADTQRGLGYYFIKEKTGSLGLALNYQPGRKQSKDSRYNGLGDVSGAAEGRLYGQWRPLGDVWTLYADAGQAVGGAKGLLYNLGTTVGFPIAGAVSGFVDVYATGGSNKYTQAYYGVTAAQSATSGYAVSSPGGGVFLTGASLGLSWAINPKTDVIASVGRTRYRGDVGNGPVVNERSQSSGLLVVNYRY